MKTASDSDGRVLVLMPTVRDAVTTAGLLHEAGVSALICRDIGHACREIQTGAGALLLTEDYILGDKTAQLAASLRTQPTWSSLPVIAVAHEGATQHLQKAVSHAITSLIVVERPVRTHSLLTVVRSALRAREHQYQIRDALLAREKQAAELEASRVELARQAEQLRSNDRRKDEFLATLAHELRNPLAPLRTGVDVLQGTVKSEKAKRTLGVMARQLTHMVRLIDDLLDVSRITRGKLELKRQPVSLAAIVDASVEDSRSQIEASQHHLRLENCDPHLMVDADPTRLEQVIGNLLNNAARYTRPGGSISLTARQERGDAVIEVTDNGIGIPENKLENVFDMFSQLDADPAGTRGGLGIGLALVRSFVEMHGGTVRAESNRPEPGTKFVVRIPAKMENALAADGYAPAAQPSSPMIAGRVLIVDDNADAADMLSLLLQADGYRTLTAYDSQSAIALAERDRPDIVILDIGLPEVSGYDVARLLRQNRNLAPLGLIALTGWGTSADKEKAKDAGFDVHLTKPIDRERLKAALRHLQDAARSH